jgi:hypothetical protein
MRMLVCFVTNLIKPTRSIFANERSEIRCMMGVHARWVLLAGIWGVATTSTTSIRWSVAMCRMGPRVSPRIIRVRNGILTATDMFAAPAQLTYDPIDDHVHIDERDDGVHAAVVARDHPVPLIGFHSPMNAAGPLVDAPWIVVWVFDDAHAVVCTSER